MWIAPLILWEQSMRNVLKDAKIAALVLAAVLLLAQVIRMERSNPPVRYEISTNPAVQSLLRRACYNCHSNQTIWPWYSNIAPASWLVASDVHEGRQHLNFSEWGSYGGDKQSHKLNTIAEEIRDGDMPPWYYSLMHSESRLSSSERGQILSWTGK
jgi:hypothetical protein